MANPAPSQCADCQDPGAPPELVKDTPKQRDYKCPKCGHMHYVGLPASVTFSKPNKSPARSKRR